MSTEQWTAVDSYFAGLFVPPDPALDGALDDSARAGFPAINVSPVLGKFLHILARTNKARAILEIGTLGAYSTIWLARALEPGGRLISLEIDPKHAALSRANLARAGLSGVAEVRLGSAHDSLPALLAEGAGPFDLVFIDADKPSSSAYLEWALKLTRPGSLIVIDNVVRNGAVADPASADANVQGVRKALEAMAANPRLVTNAMQMVGSKGYDGVAVALVI